MTYQSDQDDPFERADLLHAVRIERAELLQLFRQIQSLKSRFRPCSKRTAIVRRKWYRVNHLTSLLHQKMEKVSQNFERSLHYVGCTSQDLLLSRDTRFLLTKGFSFIPGHTPLHLSELHSAIHDFRNRMLWKAFWANKLSTQVFIPSEFRQLLRDFRQRYVSHHTAKECPNDIATKHPVIQDFVNAARHQLLSQWHNRRRFLPSNCSRSELLEIIELKNHPRIMLRKADKNLGMVVIDRDRYIQLCREEISRMDVCELPEYVVFDTMNTLQTEVTNTLHDLPWDLRSLFWDKMMQPTHDILRNLPYFYCVIKVHKDTLRGRPIVSTSSVPFVSLSAYLAWRLNTFISQHPWLSTHVVRDSQELIRSYDQRVYPQARHHLRGISFDIESLYPSLPTGTQVKASVKDFIRSFDPPDLSLLCFILDLLMDYNFFTFKGTFYQQCSGLAMGYSHSPPLANILVFLLLERHIDFTQWGLLTYRRFLDDGFSIMDGTAEDVHAFFSYLQQLSPLRFTWESGILTEGHEVSFLDLCAFFPLGTHQLCFRTHEKRLNRYNYVYYDSMHPEATKRGLVKTELIRHARNCSFFEDFVIFRNRFWHRLRARGYPKAWLRRSFLQVRWEDRERYLYPIHSSFRPTLLLFKLRFTYESMQLRVTHILHQSCTEQVLQSLGLQRKPYRILTCYRRSSNFAELLLRNRDHRLSHEIIRSVVCRGRFSR